MSNADNNWNTRTMWEIGSLLKKRESTEKSAYLNCFIFLQNALEQEFVRTKSKNNNVTFPAVHFKRFPFPGIKESPIIASILPVLIVWCFLYSCQCTIKVSGNN